MSTGKSKPKFTYGQLALVDWLLEGAGKRFALAKTHYNAWKDLDLYEVVDGEVLELSDHKAPGKTGLQDRLGGRLDIDYLPLQAEGCLLMHHSRGKREDGDPVNGFMRFMSSINYDRFGPDSEYRLIRMGSKTAEWWDTTGAPTFAPMKEKRETARKAVARTVVIGTRSTVKPRIDPEKEKSFPVGFRHPVPDLKIVRPTYVATVVKETKDRLYIQNITRIRDAARYFEEREDSPIQGRAPNQFVDKSRVIADGIKGELPRNILNVDAERVESYHEACDVALEAALEPLLSLHARLFQAESMHEDLMRDAIQSDTGPKP